MSLFYSLDSPLLLMDFVLSLAKLSGQKQQKPWGKKKKKSIMSEFVLQTSVGQNLFLIFEHII